MRAAVYARVSSEIQKDNQTIDSQLKAVTKFVEGRGWDVVGTFKDDGKSADTGKLEARTGLAAVQAAASAGKIDVVAVVDLDRLTRSNSMMERALIYDPFQRAKVQIAISSTGALLDLDDETGELLAAIGNMQSAGWLKKHKERITRGKREAISKGKKPAGPTPYGYTYERDTGKWAIDEERAEVIREVYRRVIGGESCAAIAEDLYGRGAPVARASKKDKRARGVWTRERVYDLLRKRTYTGTWIADKAKKLVVKVPQIVDDETWTSADAALARHQTRGLRRSKRVYSILGIAVCGHEGCGAPIGAASARANDRDKSRRYYYVCSRRRRPPRHGERCSEPMRRSDVVDAAVWKCMSQFLRDPKVFVQSLTAKKASTEGGREEAAKKVEAIKGKLAKLALVERSILKHFKDGVITDDALGVELREITAKRKRLEADRDEAQAAIERLDGDDVNVDAIMKMVTGGVVTPEDGGELATLARQTKTLSAKVHSIVLAALPPDRQRALVGTFVKRVVLGPGRELAIDFKVPLKTKGVELPSMKVSDYGKTIAQLDVVD